MIKTRTAVHSDIPDLIDFASAAFYEAYVEFDDPQEIRDYIVENFTTDYFSFVIDSNDRSLDILMDSDSICGYLLLQEAPAPPFVAGTRPLELARIYLRRQDAGKGLGGVLMKRAFELARQGDYDSLWLLVYRKNVSAQRFYQRYGFIEQGVTDFLFGGRVYQDPVMVAPVDSTVVG